jgi:hypothetical protein
MRLTLIFLLLIASTASAEEKKRNLLIVGQSEGYQHDSISSAMATLYNIGRNSGKWNTVFKTDCTSMPKSLKWGTKNLDAYDAVIFHRWRPDMDDSQSRFCVCANDGRASSAPTPRSFTNWPEYGR